MAPTAVQATLVVVFKSGIHRGTGHLTITPISPSEVRLTPLVLPVHFDGDDDRGLAVLLPMAFPIQEPGLYWFDISLDNQSFSHIPLRVVYHQVAPMSQMPPSAGPNTGLPPHQ
ncbi:MAG: hypothetical protein ACRD2U_05330 [Terriglobales bacterium]